MNLWKSKSSNMDRQNVIRFISNILKRDENSQISNQKLIEMACYCLEEVYHNCIGHFHDKLGGFPILTRAQ